MIALALFQISVGGLVGIVAGFVLAWYLFVGRDDSKGGSTD